MADLPDFIPDSPSDVAPKIREPLPDFIPDTRATGREKPLENKPGADEGATGVLKNLGTTTIKGLSHIPGTVGDLRELAQYGFDRAASAIHGVPMERLQKQRQEFEQRRANYGMPSLPQAPSGHDIAAPILAKTGEYHPMTPEGRLGSAALESGLAMLGPGGLKGLRSAPSTASALEMARNIMSGGARALPGGAVAGGIGDLATQYSGDPLIGMVASMAAPAAARPVQRAVRDVAAPFVSPMRPAAADRKLASFATDPEAAIEAVGNRPPKAGETLGEATLDPGVLQAEKAASKTSEKFQSHLEDRDTARKEGWGQTINALAPPADTLAPAKFFRQRLSEIENASQEALGRATETQRQAHGDLPASLPAETTGPAIQKIQADARKADRAAVRKLYDAVDPEQKLVVVTSGPMKAAQELKASINPEVSIPSPYAAPVIDMVANLRETTPFRDLTKLDQTITSKMAEAKRAGDQVGHGQLVELKGAVAQSIDQALENQHLWEQAAVSRGAVPQENTLAGRLQDQIEAWRRGRNAEAGARAGTGSASSTVVSGGYGTRGPSGGRSGEAAGPEGISGPLSPNADEGIAARLDAAKQGHAEYAQTFREGPVGRILKTNGFEGQYLVPGSNVPAVAFPKGDVGYHNVRAFLRGSDNPEMVARLQDVAASNLRNTMKDGVLSPDALQKWKQDYGPALRALDEVNPAGGFLTKFHNAASATAALEEATANTRRAIAEAQKGVAAKFLNLSHPDEVGGTLLDMVRSKTGPTQIAEAMSQMDDAARAGSRRALTESILRDHRNADGSLSGAKLRNFIAGNGASLESVYGKDGSTLLNTLAEDAARYQKAIGMQRSKTGSDSFSNFMRFAKEKGSGHIADATIGLAIVNGLGQAIMHGDYSHLGIGLAAGVAKTAVSKLRSAGIHKIDDLIQLGMENPEVGTAMMQRALNEKGQLRQQGWDDLTKSVLRAANMRETEDEHGRIGRASGGRVVDHAGIAATLVNKAAQAQTRQKADTSKFLRAPDEMVARALALANGSR